MATTAYSAAPRSPESGGIQVPLWRLYLLRAVCLFFVVQGIFYILPNIVFPDATGRGMITGILGGLWVMALIGLRYPLQLLPIFLFEFVWKTIWLLAFGLPQWMSGAGSPRLSQDLIEIGLGPIAFGLVIPWRYVWYHYVKKPAERWW